MKLTIRRQLSLFLPLTEGRQIDNLRKALNPVQYALIPAHVTLAREDEITELDNVKLISILEEAKNVSISFDPIRTFSEGKGLMIPGSKQNRAFHQLRKHLLGKEGEGVRRHRPHITIMHPRNSSCNEEIFNDVRKLALPTQISFEQVYLIEQINGGKWKVIEQFRLK